MITDEILHQRHDELRECLLGLEELFRTEKGKEEAKIRQHHSDHRMWESEYTFTGGSIFGILSCIIILRGELKRLGLIDESTELVDEGQGVAPKTQ